MRILTTAWALFSKDIRQEVKSFEIILTTALLALLIVVLTAFAFDLSSTKLQIRAASGALWIAIAFCGVLAIGRAFLRERDFAVWRAVLLSPASRAGLYLGKVISVFVFLIVVEIILLPVLDLFFHVPMLKSAHLLFPILVLATLGYSAAGTLFGSMGLKTRLKELLLGVILFPLIAPVLIMAVKATTVVLNGEGLVAAKDFIGIIVLFDAIFILGGLWLFDVLMED